MPFWLLGDDEHGMVVLISLVICKMLNFAIMCILQ